MLGWGRGPINLNPPLPSSPVIGPHSVRICVRSQFGAVESQQVHSCLPAAHEQDNLLVAFLFSTVYVIQLYTVLGALIHKDIHRSMTRMPGTSLLFFFFLP